jgi:multiple sugar transport system permease protein
LINQTLAGSIKPQARVKRRGRWVPYVLILPAVVSVLVFIIGPLLTTIYYSFNRIDVVRKTTVFNGLNNYVKLFSTTLFWKSLGINLQYATIVVVVSTLLGLLFALLLVERFVGRGLGRALLVVPWAMPWVVIGLLWSWVAHAQFGALNGVLYTLGLIKSYIPFMASDAWALVFTALASAWRQTSFSAILLLAALQTVPEELYDAAKVDGAGILERFRYITLPWLRPTLAVVVLSNVVIGFLQFDVVYMMTQGGPGDATMLISILLYRYAFVSFDLGMGAAVSNVLGLITLGFGLLFVKLIYRSQEAHGG